MCFLKKMKSSMYLILYSLVLYILFSTNCSYAINDLPLATEEKVIEKRVVDKDRTEVFTRIKDKVYIKKFKKNQNKWKLESSKIVTKKLMGLELNEVTKKGDTQLGNAIQNQLKRYGLDADLLPSKVDYSDSEFLPSVGKQMEQSCVGFSVGYYLRTYQQAKDIGWKVKEDGMLINSHVFSPTFIYNQINHGIDNGSNISDAANLIKDMGSATTDVFPYVPGDYITQPTGADKLTAFPNRVSDWKVIYTNLDSSSNIIQKTREYLNTGDLIVAGSHVGYKFIEPFIDIAGKSFITSDSYIPYKHAYLIVGYDDTIETIDGKGAFKLINSWGIGWGDKGYSYISYKAYTENILEAYVFTDLVNKIVKPLKLDMNDIVTFNILFSGTGRYDYEILGDNNTSIVQENNLQGKDGINSINWNGKDINGNIMKNGLYKLKIIPYNENVPGEPFLLEFNKDGKIALANAYANIYDNNIMSVEIPITFKNSGLLNIKILYAGNIISIFNNVIVNSGDQRKYLIKKEEFDFNNKDLSQITIKIDVQ